MKRLITVVIILIIGNTLLYSLHAEVITTKTLIREMIDIHRLAEFPRPTYKTVQFSSYDRRSKLPQEKNWFSNNDGFGGMANFQAQISMPNEKGIGEYLICDVEGPGAIVRVWTAYIGNVVKVYLDNMETPFYEGSALEFFRYPYGCYTKQAGIEKNAAKRVFMHKEAAYFPMPFAKRCRIIWQGDIRPTHFYQIQIRKYELGTKVVTFKQEDIEQCKNEILEIAEIFSAINEKWRYKSGSEPILIDEMVEPGQLKEIFFIKDGPKAIERLTLKVCADDLDLALKQVILNIVFDDYPWGQVQAPIGDFFGAAPGVNPYDSVPFTVEPDGTMICRFIMPFAESCKIILDNKGAQNVSVKGSVLPMNYKWSKSNSMYFRAKWRVNHDLVSNANERSQDMPYLIANGKGVYVGTALMLLNTNPIPSKPGAWWGEGDEKIFIDDDNFPSTFGTGAEDYFNYSWGNPEIFVTPYCAQPRNDGPTHRGFVANNRWHILDCLLFKKHISFYMELASHEENKGVSYARIGYHYGMPALRDDHVLITREDVRKLESPANWQPAARKSSKGYIFYQAEDIVEGNPNISFEKNNMWAGNRLMVWQPEQIGDELVFRLHTEEKGNYTLRITASKTPRSGSFSAKLNGRKIVFGPKKNRIVDLNVPHRQLSRNFEFLPIELDKGMHQLTLISEAKGKPIGIDFIWIKKNK